MSDAESLQPGSTFANRYRVERLIGAGGFARVYRAIQTDLDRCVALKVLRPFNDAGVPDAIAERFYREARVLSQLRDEHTITIYDYSQTDGGTLYMVSEYVDGEDLSTVLADRGTMSESAARHVLIQVLKSLREAHRHGILHRDIKPSNIMLYEHFGVRDRVKLIDFGIAKSLVTDAPDLTHHGKVVGTPRYMSPDQVRGEPLSAASDLFSLGLVLYEMLVGASPFKTRNIGEIVKTMEQFRHSLGPLENKSRGLREVARRLLEPDREDRYSSAEEVLADLEESPDGGTGAARTSSRRPTETSPGFPLDFDRSGATPTAELTELGYHVGDAANAEAGGKPPSSASLHTDPTIVSDTVGAHSSPEPFDPTIEDRVAPDDFTTRDSVPAAPARLRWMLGLGILVGLSAGVIVLMQSNTTPKKSSTPAPVTTDEATDEAIDEATDEAVDEAVVEARSGIAAAFDQSTSRARNAGTGPSKSAGKQAGNDAPPEAQQPDAPQDQDRAQPPEDTSTPDESAAPTPRPHQPRTGEKQADRPDDQDSKPTRQADDEADDEPDSTTNPKFKAFDQLEPRGQ